jgi:1,4-dihydroxy-2-naphthoate octaprenyltransferase
VTALVLADTAWWGPLLIVAGAILGIVVSYLLLVLLGAPAPSRLSRRIGYEETAKTNYPSLNPVAILVVLGIVALIVGLSIGLASE